MECVSEISFSVGVVPVAHCSLNRGIKTSPKTLEKPT